MQDLDRGLARLAPGSLERGAERRREEQVRTRRRAGLGRLAEVDFSQPLPDRPTRLPRGLVPVLVFVALLLAAMIASVALRIR